MILLLCPLMMLFYHGRTKHHELHEQMIAKLRADNEQLEK
ncbi:DUF2933 domain-containing protein [Parageobacillus thermoglucosidasius]